MKRLILIMGVLFVAFGLVAEEWKSNIESYVYYYGNGIGYSSLTDVDTVTGNPGGLRFHGNGDAYIYPESQTWFNDSSPGEMYADIEVIVYAYVPSLNDTGYMNIWTLVDGADSTLGITITANSDSAHIVGFPRNSYSYITFSVFSSDTIFMDSVRVVSALSDTFDYLAWGIDNVAQDSTYSLTARWEALSCADLDYYVVWFTDSVYVYCDSVRVFPPDTSVTIDSLWCGKEYAFSVQSVDTAGNKSKWSRGVLYDVPCAEDDTTIYHDGDYNQDGFVDGEDWKYIQNHFYKTKSNVDLVGSDAFIDERDIGRFLDNYNKVNGPKRIDPYVP